ncbi:hypothetical protein MMC25_008345 [Agyrium rufum]|nr:hypothetical protein [Agyrium rufum]
MRSERFVNDRYTWKIALDVDKIEVPNIPNTVVELAEFGLSWGISSNVREESHVSLTGTGFHTINANPFRCEVLKYTYIMPDLQHRSGAFWPTFAVPKATKLAASQLQGLLKRHRSEPISDSWAMVESLPDYESGELLKDVIWATSARPKHPSHWKFYDDHVSQWYQQWHASKAGQGDQPCYFTESSP